MKKYFRVLFFCFAISMSLNANAQISDAIVNYELKISQQKCAHAQCNNEIVGYQVIGIKSIEKGYAEDILIPLTNIMSNLTYKYQNEKEKLYCKDKNFSKCDFKAYKSETQINKNTHSMNDIKAAKMELEKMALAAEKNKNDFNAISYVKNFTAMSSLSSVIIKNYYDENPEKKKEYLARMEKEKTSTENQKQGKIEEINNGISEGKFEIIDKIIELLSDNQFTKDEANKLYQNWRTEIIKSMDAHYTNGDVDNLGKLIMIFENRKETLTEKDLVANYSQKYHSLNRKVKVAKIQQEPIAESERKLLGNWTFKAKEYPKNTEDVYVINEKYEFKEDKSFSLKWKKSLWLSTGTATTNSYKGYWKLDGNNLLLIITHMDGNEKFMEITYNFSTLSDTKASRTVQRKDLKQNLVYNGKKAK